MYTTPRDPGTHDVITSHRSPGNHDDMTSSLKNKFSPWAGRKRAVVPMKRNLVHIDCLNSPMLREEFEYLCFYSQKKGI